MVAVLNLALTEREYRLLPDAELHHALRDHQRWHALAAADVAAQHPDLLPTEALALVEEWRAFNSHHIVMIRGEQARRRRAAAMGVPIDRPRFNDATLDRLREAFPVDRLAGEELGAVLDKHGRGPCPMCRTSERSTAFAAYVASGRVVCYACGFNADAIGIVQAARRVTFPEAVALLAERAGIGIQGGRRLND